MRRSVRIEVAFLVSLWFGCVGARAQDDYPTRPIQIIVPFAAAGSVDITFRILAPVLGKILGQSVIVVDRPGGAATIGMNFVKNSPPDGYMLGAATFSFAADPSLLKHMPYNPLTDFEPITQVSESPSLLLVNPKTTPVKSVQEFINYAKSKPPGSLNYSSVGVGSTGHLFAALFCAKTGIKMTHVPFTQDGYTAVAQGLDQLMFGPIPSATPWIHDGRLVPLAVSSLKPIPIMPGLPTISDTVPGFDATEWPSLVAPKGTPRSVVDKIQHAVVIALQDPDVKKRLATLGSVPVGSTPEQLHDHIASQIKVWGQVVQEIGLQPQ